MKTKTNVNQCLADIEFLIDTNTHLLPSMDDDSITSSDASRLIESLKDENINYICLTPRYNKNNETIESFLARREEAYEKLDDITNIYKGCEIDYYENMSEDKNLSLLSIEPSRYLLIHLPARKWSSKVIQDLKKMIKMGYTPIISHFEDCYKKNKKIIFELKNAGVLCQACTIFFTKMKTSKKALKCFNSNFIDLVASNIQSSNESTTSIADAIAYLITNAKDDALYNLLNNYEEVVENLLNTKNK